MYICIYIYIYTNSSSIPTHYTLYVCIPVINPLFKILCVMILLIFHHLRMSVLWPFKNILRLHFTLARRVFLPFLLSFFIHYYNTIIPVLHKAHDAFKYICRTSAFVSATNACTTITSLNPRASHSNDASSRTSWSAGDRGR